ncbi:MAG TPA: hypothetical protein VKM55_25200 [Candidatus Lokiarchaeia archaeon]|nr:hypothetical protein [Candidatus Lokiarchaeia archaeon]
MRIAICKAVEDDPTLRYVDLQERFSTSAYTVARALEGDVEQWTAMLGKGAAARAAERESATPVQPMPAKEEVEHAVVAIRGGTGDDGKVAYLILDDTTGAWDTAAGTTPLDVLAGHFKMGFEVVAVMKTERGAGPLAGTWEVWLKRKIHGKAGVKP